MEKNKDLIQKGGYELPAVRTIVFETEQTLAASSVIGDSWGLPGAPGDVIEPGNNYNW